MSHSFTQINIHLIFSTKFREPWLTAPIRPRAFGYLAQLARNKGATDVLAGGWNDHVHMLFELPPKVVPADMVRDIKANGSRWIRSEFKLQEFRWQEGYTAFSVSGSICGRVRRYIETQEEHHRHVSFEEELKKWLAKHGKAFDPSMLD